jgi:cytoskeleton protein RodZ
MAMAMVTTGSTGDGSTSIAPDRETVVSLGELLRQARERKGLTLEHLASETKIPRRHLEAIEHYNLTVMPGEFYKRAEIRTYARAVGLDQQLLLAQFESVKPVEVREAPAEIPGTRESVGRRTHVVMALGVVTAVILLGRAIAERPEAPVQPSEGPPAVGSVSQPVPATPADTVTPPPERPVLPVPPAPSLVETAPPIAKTGSAAAAVTTPSVPAGTPGAPADSPDVLTDSPVGQVADPDVQAAAPDAQTAATETRPTAGPAAALVVTTEPAGARVTVNGIGWGLTPVTIPYLPPGDKRIRVSKEGYTAQERVLHIAAGRPHSLDVRLDGAP